MSSAIRAAVIGTGAMGRHHVRILSELADAELVGVHDEDSERLAAICEQHGARGFDDVDALLDKADAVVLAVPTSAHLELGRRAFEAGCHVLVEKPIALDARQARELIEAAGDHVLHVGHVEFHNPAVQSVLEVDNRPRFVEVQRLSVFSPRSLDIDVVQDLMIHDLQIVHALDPSPVREVRAVGVQVLSDRIDLADARLELESGCVVKLTASRVSDQKVRTLRIFADDYYSLDYAAQTVKGFRLERSSSSGGHPQILPLNLDVRTGEPLLGELNAFLAACAGRPAVAASGEDGLRALESARAVAEAAAD